MKKRNPFIHNPPDHFRDMETLSDEERQQEAEELKDALTYHHYLASVLEKPEISRKQYEHLRSRLENLERKRIADSPEQRSERAEVVLDKIRSLSCPRN